MRDLDSKLIFESYRAKLINEEFNPDVIASKAASLDPQAGREFLRNLRDKDPYRFTNVIQKIISGGTESGIINKFRSEVWPKIKALILSKNKEEIDVDKSDRYNNGLLGDWYDGVLKARSAAIDKAQGDNKDEEEIDVNKSDLDNDGKLNDYEKARGAAIDKARGGNGKMPEKK